MGDEIKLPKGEDAEPILDFTRLAEKLESMGGTGGFVFIYQLDEEAGKTAVFQTNMPAEAVYKMLDDICEQMESRSSDVIGGEEEQHGRRQ